MTITAARPPTAARSTVRRSHRDLQDNPTYVRLAQAAAAGRIERIYITGRGMYDTIRTKDGRNNVTDEVTLMRRAGWLEGPFRQNNPQAGTDTFLWRLSGTGWKVVARAALAARTHAAQPPVDATIIPATPGRGTNMILWRAAIYLETAACAARGRTLRISCSPDGIYRTCFACVYCLIAAARQDYARTYPLVCQADLSDSMIAAFDVVEADLLHERPPPDPEMAVTMLLSAAGDTYRRSQPVGVAYTPLPPARLPAPPELENGAAFGPDWESDQIWAVT